MRCTIVLALEGNTLTHCNILSEEAPRKEIQKAVLLIGGDLFRSKPALRTVYNPTDVIEALRIALEHQPPASSSRAGRMLTAQVGPATIFVVEREVTDLATPL